MWDVWIHILGIGTECACWRAGGRKGRPYGESQSISRNGGRGTPQGGFSCPFGAIHLQPLPYGLPERGLELGREAPWGFRRGHAPGSQRAGEGTRPYGVFTNGSTYRKRDRFLTCPLKHRGETQFRTKFLCFLSFSKKGSYTGPWRKRSIISWVREMAEPPWGRFSRSNQVPSPSSSSWRVTVSSSVSRSQ